MREVKVIGAGLAGCEAAYQLANLGVKVKLYEQKPVKRHEAFKTDYYSELLCSNSLRSDDPITGAGLLKEEMKILNSLIIEAALATRVEAGRSLAVDREGFSKYITDKINSHPNIEVINEEVTEIDTEVPTLIASGPLCEGELSKNIQKLCGKDYLYFYDAVSPIVEKDSIDFSKAYYKSRYEDTGDYINCPLTKEEFFDFYNAVLEAKKIAAHTIDDEIYFEGCMPFEEMARRGRDTLLFGPMKPVGLEHNGVRPYAVVQLRKDNAIDTLYNIVGFQTHLTFGEQERVLKMVPALRNLSIVRYGVMHRNTYINSPKVLNNKYQFINYPNVFIAGQISGVEGYIESAASGLYSALNMYQYLNGEFKVELEADTMIGAMANYISDESIDKLVPMNANFGIFKIAYNGPKKEKKAYCSNHAQEKVKEYKEKFDNLYR
ncbi:MAG: methylenetetrahydrofolate--tRNA-(uracil(54)-C(5))-methyltransferase (FADH(2)-oxidizing) TrmFO [Erysipelotrichaceae bacterium]|nr:methylenetetrahydrofolate--tRNA-(uracil(54)-C(5))-methyltransferase (FADH(2)-oxidizing) TrmFO [Erysipelotrichaceae bacterium]